MTRRVRLSSLSRSVLGASALIVASFFFSLDALGQVLQVSPTTGIVASGPQGGPFSASTFAYTVSAPNGPVRYTISNVPSWLSASSTSGSATSSGTAITFSVNSRAKSLRPNTYKGTINFKSGTFRSRTQQGTTLLAASLTVDPKSQYTIAVTASPSADGTVGGGGRFAAGSSQTVTATANSGFSFVNWTANGGVVSTSASYTFTLNGNVTLVANFVPLYTVAVSASPSAGGIVVGGGSFPAGSSQTVTATANSGYKFVNWTQNGSVVSTLPSYTFTPNANVTLIANFTSIATQYTIAVSASPSAGGAVIGGGTFAAGSSDTVSATPNSGYRFVNWTSNGSPVSASASYTLTLNSNVTLVANFATSTGIIPPDRNFAWNPGMMSQGGIPSRTTVCATLSPSGSDDSAAIQAKLDSCPDNQVVMLNPGTFIVNNLLLIHSAITLRGSGPGQTVLTKTNGAKARTTQVVSGTSGILTPVNPGTYSYDAQPIIIVGPSRWPGPDNSTSVGLSVDGAQGATSVTVSSASGFAPGQFVLLDEASGASWQPVPPGFGCTDSILASPCPPLVWQGDRVAWNMHYPQQQYQDDNRNSNSSGPYDSTPGVLPAAMSWFSRTDRPTNEIKEIASVSGNTITFTSPLTISYRTSHQAQLTRYTATGSQSTANSIHVRNAGVENLSTVGGADGEIRFENAAYSWAKSVEVTQWLGEGFAVDGSFRVEIRDSYAHTGSWPEPGGAGYIISLADGSSEILIENNILIDACKQMVMRSSGAGSVVAYNYADDSWDFDTPGWVEVGLNASHMAGPHHVLFEGNYSQNVDSDYTHGNAIYLTFFRNWLSGQRRDFTDSSNIRTVGLGYGSWWDSFVGNVLGRPGQMIGWNYTDPAMSCDASGSNCVGNNGNWSGKDIWELGYDPERWSMYPDSQTLSTVIRDGNYDFVTNLQQWHNTPGGFTMPNSMYLTSKPAFFGNNPWPWLDPSSGATYTLPAKARYDAGTPLCGC